MVRLFVGGLPPGVTIEELGQRFTPFGEVTECSIAAPKDYGPGAVFPRCFGHVELEPKDEAALRKCIGAYNGCKWRGSQMKCALAHQHYPERRQHEAAKAAAAAIEEAALTLPPLEPGSKLRLKPTKASSTIEVVLGSGQKMQHFPQQAHHDQVKVQLGWEALEAPPASGYLYEQLLQRVAANLPPELLAIVEERRRQGKLIAEEREQRLRAERAAAGVEIGHDYSDQSDWELGSDDDAATAAGRATAALATRERRQAAAAAAIGAGPGSKKGAAEARRQRQLQHSSQAKQVGGEQQEGMQAQAQAPAVPPKQRRIRVVDFLEADEAGGQREGHAGGAAQAATDLSRFNSDSDAEWGGSPTGVTWQQRPQLERPAVAQPQQDAARLRVQVQPAPAPRLGLQRERGHSQASGSQLSGSSGSSGGSELEEWLAGAGEELADDPVAIMSEEAAALDGEASSGSSGGSELEEFLAAAGGDDGSAGAAGQEEEAEEGTEADPQLLAADLTAPMAGRLAGVQQDQRPAQPRQQEQQKQRGVVELVEGDEEAHASQRQRWQKPIIPAAADLSRFASSSDEESGEGPASLGPAAMGGKRRAEGQHSRAQKRRQSQLIPQVDGAADSDSSSSGEQEESEESEKNSSSSGGSEGSDESGSEEGTSGSSSSSSGDEEEEQLEGKLEVGRQSAALASEGHGTKAGGGTSSSSEGDEEVGEEEAEEEAAAAAVDDGVAALQEQQRQLAALFPEGAAFRRNEPLAQVEAAWRVSRESWVQDYRQKHRQAVRMLGRAGGGGNKRQRKG